MTNFLSNYINRAASHTPNIVGHGTGAFTAGAVALYGPALIKTAAYTVLTFWGGLPSLVASAVAVSMTGIATPHAVGLAYTEGKVFGEKAVISAVNYKNAAGYRNLDHNSMGSNGRVQSEDLSGEEEWIEVKNSQPKVSTRKTSGGWLRVSV